MPTLSALEALSLAINLANNDPALVTHLSDWADYAWTETAYQPCSVVHPCQLPRQRWDWHRSQWIDFSYGRDPASGRVIVTLTLTDQDPSDDDNVCVTVAFLDVAKDPVLVFHQNWHVGPGQVVSHDFALPANAALPPIQTIALGSKQCRKGPREDDEVYARVRQNLGQSPEQWLR